MGSGKSSLHTHPKGRKPQGLQTNSCSNPYCLRASLETKKRSCSVQDGHFAAKKVPPTGSSLLGTCKNGKQTQKKILLEK